MQKLNNEFKNLAHNEIWGISARSSLCCITQIHLSLGSESHMWNLYSIYCPVLQCEPALPETPHPRLTRTIYVIHCIVYSKLHFQKTLVEFWKTKIFNISSRHSLKWKYQISIFLELNSIRMFNFKNSSLNCLLNFIKNQWILTWD